MRFAPAIVLVLASVAAYAADEVYRWVDKAGVVHYGGQPPSKDAKPAALPQLQTYSNRLGSKGLPAIAADVAAGKPPAVSAADIKDVRVLSPAQDEVFRDPLPTVVVAAAVLPALPTGAGVVFYLDGAAKNSKPITATSMTFSGVERGEHTVAVAVVDAAGKELKRSAPVTFHSKPPSAK